MPLSLTTILSPDHGLEIHTGFDIRSKGFQVAVVDAYNLCTADKAFFNSV